LPLLIAQSQEWSAIPKNFHGTTTPHFTVVKAIATQALQATNGSWFMTLTGTVHASITDVGIIAPSFASFFTNNTAFLTLDPAVAVAKYVNVTNEFLRYVKGAGIHGVLAQEVKYPSWQNVSNATDLGASPWEVHVGTGTGKSKTSAASTTARVGADGHGVMTLICVMLGMVMVS
jgi:hypothetical protein